MNRRDLVAFENFNAALYRREADARRKRYPAIAAQLDHWATASEARAESIRVGPLFEGPPE
jgi:hypothetical protein